MPHIFVYMGSRGLFKKKIRFAVQREMGNRTGERLPVPDLLLGPGIEIVPPRTAHCPRLGKAVSLDTFPGRGLERRLYLLTILPLTSCLACVAFCRTGNGTCH